MFYVAEFHLKFNGTRLFSSSLICIKTHRHFPSPHHPSAQAALRPARSCIPADWTHHIMTRTSPGLIIPLWCHRGIYKRFQDPVEERKQCRRRETLGPHVAVRQHLQDPPQLSLWACVLERSTNYPRHRPRAKVGGCGNRGAPAALISACVHRPSFVRTTPCPFWEYMTYAYQAWISISWEARKHARLSVHVRKHVDQSAHSSSALTVFFLQDLNLTQTLAQ